MNLHFAYKDRVTGRGRRVEDGLHDFKYFLCISPPSTINNKAVISSSWVNSKQISGFFNPVVKDRINLCCNRTQRKMTIAGLVPTSTLV